MDQIKCKQCHRLGHDNTCSTELQHFVWKYGGKEVFLYGEWSKFQISIQMKAIDDIPYHFECYVPLNPCQYRYKFWVDGQWRIDPNAPSIKNIYDSEDNIIQVFPVVYEAEDDQTELENYQTVVFSLLGIRAKIKTQLRGNQIILKGSWDNWITEIKIENSQIYIKLLPGIYQFKFIVDGMWTIDNSLMVFDNQNGLVNNIIKIKEKRRSFSYQFDPYNLVWSQIKMDGLKSTGIVGHSMSCIGDQIYLFGGQNKGNFSNNLFMIDMLNNDVNNINVFENVPQERAFHQTIEYGNKIIVFGGLNSKEVFNDYHVFNTLSKTWNTVNIGGQIPSKREKFTFTSINNDTFILYGGYECSEDESIEINYDDFYALDLIKMKWILLQFQSPFKYQRSCHTATSFQQEIYIFGGIKRENCSPVKFYEEVIKFNYTHLQLEQLETIGRKPEGRYGHSGVQINKYLAIYGGKNMNGNLLNDVWFLDLKNNSWILPNIKGINPGSRWIHSMCVNRKEELFIMGGFKGPFVVREMQIYKLSQSN